MAHNKKTRKFVSQRVEAHTPDGAIGAVAAGAVAGVAAGAALGGAIGALPGIAVGAALGGTAAAIAAETAVEAFTEREIQDELEKDQAIERAVDCPEKFYRSPDDVIADERLKRKDKLRILESWAEDEDAMIRAAGESMTPKLPTGTGPDELLQRIKAAKTCLK